MIIDSLDSLNRDINQDNLYNFFIQDFFYRTDIPMMEYIVPIEFDMRLDLVCNKLYGSTDNLEFLMTINDIDIPFNVSEGDRIIYCDESQIPSFNVSLESGVKNTSDVIYTNNPSKISKVDKNRKDYLEKVAKLGPNGTTDKANVIIKGDNINIRK